MLYWLLWGVAYLLVRVLYRVSYTGGGNIPRRGPVIVCANHLGWWDPIIFALACRRRIYFMAKAELFENRAFGLLLRALGAFPVRRGEPDRKALSRSLEVLETGNVLGIFPEGTRSRAGVLRRAEPGVGLIILKSGAPVVPGYFQGPYRFRHPVSLVIGRPMTIKLGLNDARSPAEQRQAAADTVMKAIAALGGREEDYAVAPAERRGQTPPVSNTSVGPGQQ